jgi:hypothetical protein
VPPPPHAHQHPFPLPVPPQQQESAEHPDAKLVTLRGAPENVARAKESIKQLLEEALAPQEGEVEERITCPPGIVGRIIGRGGETIRCVCVCVGVSAGFLLGAGGGAGERCACACAISTNKRTQCGELSVWHVF